MELLERAHCGDLQAKEEMILENSGLIWSIVRRYTGRGVDEEDLYQLGCMGFLKALEGFDFAYGTKFSTYAVPKIAGEIRRFLRDDGSVKVSRTLKEQAVHIRSARNELTLKLGREPKVHEVAELTGLTLEEIALAEAAALPADSLYRPAGDDGVSLEQLIPGEEIEEQIVESVDLHDAVLHLEPRLRQIVDLRYFRGLTQEKTASILGISQVQVSRLERKALASLRETLQEN